MKNTAKMDLFLIWFLKKNLKMSAGILKNSWLSGKLYRAAILKWKKQKQRASSFLFFKKAGCWTCFFLNLALFITSLLPVQRPTLHYWVKWSSGQGFLVDQPPLEGLPTIKGVHFTLQSEKILDIKLRIRSSHLWFQRVYTTHHQICSRLQFIVIVIHSPISSCYIWSE